MEHVIEVRDTWDEQGANELLGDGWIVLSVFQWVGEDGTHHVQYIMGRIR